MLLRDVWHKRIKLKCLKRAPHIDIVLGTHNIQHINEMIEEVQRGHTHQISVDMDNTVLPELEAKPNVHSMLGYLL